MNSTKAFAVTAVVYGIVFAVGSQVVLHQLDQATAKQCREHAWPAHADQLHRDWCIGNGYKI